MVEEEKDVLVRWHRIVGILLVAVVVAEGLAQLAVFSWAGERFRSFSPYIWSPYGLVRNNPAFTSPKFRISPHGFRSTRDYEPKKPPGTIRVLMLGGSVLYSGLGGAVLAADADRVDSSSTIAQFLESRLSADPELKGLHAEVINAAVNFNRIVEVSSAYLTEYAYWEPDLVIICGSANNFSNGPKAGSIYERSFQIQTAHPWKLEFERLCNGHSLGTLLEFTWRQMAEHSASAAILRKGLTFAVDSAFAETASLQTRLGLEAPPPAQSFTPAGWDEYDRYIAEYLDYADAIVYPAKRQGQQVAFFWEYFLTHLDGIRPRSASEEAIYRGTRRASDAVDKEFDVYSRDKVRAYCESRGVAFLDPIDVLRQPSAPVYIDSLHYTREGNHIMADFMYEGLKDFVYSAARKLKDETAPGGNGGRPPDTPH